jgi:hypothetical protein
MSFLVVRSIQQANGPLSLQSFSATAGTDPVTDTDTTIFWTSAGRTSDNKLIFHGAGTHIGVAAPQPNYDNGVRVWNPAVGGESTYRYASSQSEFDVVQHNNHTWFYSQARDWGFFPQSGVYDYQANAWLAGSAPPLGGGSHPNVYKGTGATAIVYEQGTVEPDWPSIYNGHECWSPDEDCGFIVGGGRSGYSGTWIAPYMYLIVPSHNGVNATAVSQGNPYTIYRKTVPETVGGVTCNKIRARDSCCFLDGYVYWCGGQEDLTEVDTAHFFRMAIAPHLTSTSESLTTGAGAIERLTDCPVSFNFGLMMADETLKALLVVSSQGIYAYDTLRSEWVDVTPGTYTTALFNGKALPYGCMGQWITDRFYWRPGHNTAWNEGDPANWQTIMSLKLQRS